MRYVCAVAFTLFYLGGLRVLFAFAGVVFFVAGALDFFLFHNQAAGLAAAFAGLVSLSCGYMFELWVGDVVTEVRDDGATAPAVVPEQSLYEADQPFGIIR